jgi:hypothetical protein
MTDAQLPSLSVKALLSAFRTPRASSNYTNAKNQKAYQPTNIKIIPKDYKLDQFKKQNY